MKKVFFLAGVVALSAGGAPASELPAFEVMGFPISRHQVAVLGSANVQERAAEPSLVLAGMPASPHQISVLSLRQKIVTEVSAAQATSTGVSRP
jgi:hypothetical protein